METIALTGGIASGKSTVARAWRAAGITVIDADQLAREVVAPGTPGAQEIAARWPDVVGPDGTIDRAALGRRVFGDAEARKTLESIVHPRVGALSLERLQQAAARGEILAVYEVPLLFEKGLDTGFGTRVLVAVSPEVQKERLMRRDGLDADAAQARLDAQWPLADKIARSTHVLWNDGSPDDLARRAADLLRQLLAAAAAAQASP